MLYSDPIVFVFIEWKISYDWNSPKIYSSKETTTHLHSSFPTNHFTPPPKLQRVSMTPKIKLASKEAAYLHKVPHFPHWHHVAIPSSFSPHASHFCRLFHDRSIRSPLIFQWRQYWRYTDLETVHWVLLGKSRVYCESFFGEESLKWEWTVFSWHRGQREANVNGFLMRISHRSRKQQRQTGVLWRSRYVCWSVCCPYVFQIFKNETSRGRMPY